MSRWLSSAGAVAATVLLVAVHTAPSLGALSQSTLRGRARGVAERTFIYEQNYGGPQARGRHKRRFSLRGQDPYTVKAADGSLFTAFQATLNSVDGTGDIVLLFDELRFVGWAEKRIAGNLDLSRRGNAILVRYWHYRKRNSLCCPSSKKAITYRWDGTRVVASGEAPLIFGRPGELLHFSRPK